MKQLEVQNVMNTTSKNYKKKPSLINIHLNARLKSCLTLQPVLRGEDGNLHFAVPSMNRLNQTESASFFNLSFWTFI
jgi:hypothetical protein